MDTLPAEWALDEATSRAETGFSTWSAFTIRNGPHTLLEKAVVEVARLIEKHEPKPVDPLLLAMRGEHAQYCEITSLPETAKAYLDGKCDERLARTIDYVRERFDITEKAK